MRSLDRQVDPRDFPADLIAPERRNLELQLLREAREIRRGKRKSFSFQARRWQEAKGNLLRESHDKCAYCEVNFRTVAYGDVEHYRPKSRYWWLAYSYFNYSASCQLCNQKFKGSKFPIANRKWRQPHIRKNTTDRYIDRIAGTLTVDARDELSGMPLGEYLKKHGDERPLAVDPYLDDPREYFSYHYNDLTREVFLEPLNPLVEEIANATITLFGLNRKELRDLRYRGLFQYRFYRQLIDQAGTDPTIRMAARNIIEQEYLDPRAEFSGMYAYFEGVVVDPVPTRRRPPGATP